MNNNKIIELQLGDIVYIVSPTNTLFNSKYFYISFINQQKITIHDIYAEPMLSYSLVILEDKTLEDKSIRDVIVAESEDDVGFANQNSLLPETWIDIYFKHVTPFIKTGLITSLQEDMIQVKLYPSGEIIYINFDYMGLPEYLEKIEIRDSPIPQNAQKEDHEDHGAVINDVLIIDEDEGEEYAPNNNVSAEYEMLNKVINEAEVGDYLPEIVEEVNIDESQRRYSLENQLENMLNNMLSKIPIRERTPQALADIHRTIERFKQLRESASIFDENNNVIGIVEREEDEWKPIICALTNTQFDWLTPVVKIIPKEYFTDSEKEIAEMAEGLKPRNIVGENINYYKSWLQIIQPYFTPFTYLPREQDDALIERLIPTADISVITNIAKKHPTSYTRLLTSLEYLKSNPKMTQITRLPATSNDEMSLVGVLANLLLADYSRRTLPATNIYEKTNLSKVAFYNYLYNKHHAQTVNERDVSLSLSKATYYSSANPANTTYDEFMNQVIPNTRAIFKLVKPTIKEGTLSLSEVVKSLEPFAVYIDDIDREEYGDIRSYLHTHVAKHIVRISNLSRIMQKFKHIQSKPQNVAIINSLFYPSVEDIYKRYGLMTEDNNLLARLTPSEVFSRLYYYDYTDLFSAIIQERNIHLNVSGDIDKVIQDLESQINAKKKDKRNPCKPMILTKRYTSVEDLEADNGRDIFYDKIYDDTPYDIISDAEKEEYLDMPEAKASNFTIKVGERIRRLTKKPFDDCIQIAIDVVTGRKYVRDGDYALLVTGLIEFRDEDDETDAAVVTGINTKKEGDRYYKRINNRWIYDHNPPLVDCILRLNCTENEQYDCVTTKLNKMQAKARFLERMVKYFENQMQYSQEELRAMVSAKVGYCKYTATVLQKIHNYRERHYNEMQYYSGLNYQNMNAEGEIVSPYIAFKDAIMSETSFVKKQKHIILFADKFTNPATGEQDPNWLYCNVTNTKLLPAFLYRLAVAWNRNPEDYATELELVKKEIGKLGDDGNAWVSKYGGAVIVEINFETDEGYDENGFKIKARDVLEEDEAVLVADTAVSSAVPVKKYTTPMLKMISEIVNAISFFMGINVDSEKEFMVSIANEYLQNGALISKEDYEANTKRDAKEPVPYQKIYDKTVLLMTMSSMVVGIQTAMPSIKSKKTFPGCVRDFGGYPFGAGDGGLIEYIACIVYNIKRNTRPWDAVKKVSVVNLVKNMRELFIERYYLPDTRIQQMMDKKHKYLEKNPEKEIPEELEITRWTNFLPPLLVFKLEPSNIAPISEEFLHETTEDIRNARTSQLAKLLIIKTRTIFYSLAIQRLIQEVVSKKTLIMVASSTNTPYLENSCCNEGYYSNVLSYFANSAKDIGNFVKYANRIQSFLQDVEEYTTARRFYCAINSKRNRVQLNENVFNENTIYAGFIHFCKYNTKQQIDDEELLSICGGPKPDDFFRLDSLAEKIAKLKAVGRNYTNVEFVRLIKHVQRKQQLNISFTTEITTKQQHLTQIIDTAMPNDDCSDMVTILKKPTKERERMMYEEIQRVKAQLKDKMKLSKKKYEAFAFKLNSLFREASKEAERVNNVQFLKTTLFNMTTIFPQIILNCIDYTNTKGDKLYNSIVNNEWGFSKKHNSDILDLYMKYYGEFKTFYRNNRLNLLLNEVVRSCSQLLTHIAQNTNASSMLDFEFYFYYVVNVYLSLAERQLYVSRYSDSNNQLDEDEDEDEDERDDVFPRENQNRDLQVKTLELLNCFFNLIFEHSKMTNITYSDVMEVVFKTKEREKDSITDRLKSLNIEELNVERVMKKNKMGVWSKGLSKGLISYVKSDYDNEQEDNERTRMFEIALLNGAVEANVNQVVDDMEEDEEIGRQIDKEEYALTMRGEDDDDEEDYDDDMDGDYNDYGDDHDRDE